MPRRRPKRGPGRPKSLNPKSRRATETEHVYLWRNIPRDVWNEAERLASLEEPPQNMKEILERLLRKYAGKPPRMRRQRVKKLTF